MARIKIELPSKFPFSTELAVRITDINYGGHLGNAAVLGLVHEARVQFLQHYGFSERDIGGASLIMSDAAIVYRSEGFYGEKISISVAASEFTRTGFDLYFLLTHQATSQELARVKTGMVAFDYTARKICGVPEQFRAALSAAPTAT